MLDHFERSPYFLAVQKEQHLGAHGIAVLASRNPQFRYGHLQYEESLYSSYASVRTILTSTGYALANAISHLAQTLFQGLPALVAQRDSRPLKAHFFCFLRDLQEAYGWLCRLVWPSYGQFHIQESRFHQNCYQCFSQPVENPFETGLNLVERGELKAALRLLKSHAPSTAEDDPELQKLAEVLFDLFRIAEQKELVEETFPFIAFGSLSRLYYLTQTARSEFAKDEWEAALNTTFCLADFPNERENLLQDFAKTHREYGRIVAALRTAKLISRESDELNTLLIDLAQDFQESGSLDSAKEALERVSDPQQREGALPPLILRHLRSDHFSEALKLALWITDPDRRREQVLVVMKKTHDKREPERLEALVRELVMNLAPSSLEESPRLLHWIAQDCLEAVRPAIESDNWEQTYDQLMEHIASSTPFENKTQPISP